jgi:serine/threonine protein kinase
MSQSVGSIPARLGDFEIVREIGRGGMGLVYEARQVSLNRRVALKVLSAGLGLSAQAVARFRREAEAAARLHHTNIVPIYAIGEEDGTHYYAMELVEGPSLNAVIRELRACSDRTKSPPAQGPAGRTLDRSTPATKTALLGDAVSSTLPAWVMETIGDAAAPERKTHDFSTSDGSATAMRTGSYFDTVARLTAEVADALDYAHHQGVVHRDIKPSNLLLSPAERLSINDFGLARILEQPGITVSGEFMGTPVYMSPEQVAVGRAPVDHRTDIYSLGATLYELLTLSPLFPGVRREQIIAQIISREPVLPRRINRKIPVDLETICLKALEKAPDRRYQTAGAMAIDLRAYLNRYAISAKRIGPLGRAVKWVRRHPAVTALLGLATVLAAAAGLFAHAAHLSRERMVEVQRQKAIDDALLAAIGGDFFGADAAIRQAELHGAGTGWIRMLRGQVALQQGHARTAIEDLEQAVRLLPESVAARAMLARACVVDGQYGRYYSTLTDLEQLTPRTAEDFLFKGVVEMYPDPAGAAELLDEAVKQRDSPLARAVRADARSHKAMMTGDLSDVEAALEDAAVAKSMLPDKMIALRVHLFSHLVAANILGDLGQDDRRASILVDARGDAQALERFPGVPEAQRVRMQYFELLREHNAALEAARWYSEAMNDPRPYAESLYGRGNFAKALQVLDQAPDRAKGFFHYADRAYILAELPGRYEEALTAADAAQDHALQVYIPDVPAAVFYLLGKPSKAISSARQMRERFQPLPRWARGWYLPLLDFCAGQLSPKELLEAAGASRCHQCEAHFHIALQLLVKGDRAGAREHFRLSRDTHVLHFYEYGWSNRFLARLEQDPAWPQWIPVKPAAARPAATQPVDSEPLPGKS